MGVGVDEGGEAGTGEVGSRAKGADSGGAGLGCKEGVGSGPVARVVSEEGGAVEDEATLHVEHGATVEAIASLHVWNIGVHEDADDSSAEGWAQHGLDAVHGPASGDGQTDIEGEGDGARGGWWW